MTDNPFAVLESPAPVAEPIESGIVVPHGDVFVFDLETVPDESRFPRPVRTEKEERPDADCDLEKIVSMTVPGVKDWIKKLSTAQLEKLMKLENGSKKPRSGITDAIQGQLDEDAKDPFEDAMVEWRKNAFNPFACRIVALGIKSATHRITMLAENDEAERELIRILWLHIAHFRTRCGYNITGFDDLVLIVRSMLLGVDATERISRKKWGDKGSIDLMTVLFPSGKPEKLKELCRMLGIIPPAGYEMSGDQVFDLIEAGDWDGVHRYVSSDADIEFEIYNKLREYVLF